MDAILLYLAAALCVLTACIHSYFGEKRLIAPVIKSNNGVMVKPLARHVLRLAWHWTSLLWALVGAYLFLAAQGEIAHRPLLLGVGLVHLAAGVIDGVMTRGKHIGWPPIVLIGVLVLTALWISAPASI